MGRHRCTYGVIQKCIVCLVRKFEEKRHLGRSRHRWEDNIKMHLREVGCDAGLWIDLAQDRVQWQAYVRKVMNLWVP